MTPKGDKNIVERSLAEWMAQNPGEPDQVDSERIAPARREIRHILDATDSPKGRQKRIRNLDRQVEFLFEYYFKTLRDSILFPPGYFDHLREQGIIPHDLALPHEFFGPLYSFEDWVIKSFKHTLFKDGTIDFLRGRKLELQQLLIQSNREKKIKSLQELIRERDGLRAQKEEDRISAASEHKLERFEKRNLDQELRMICDPQVIQMEIDRLDALIARKVRLEQCIEEVETEQKEKIQSDVKLKNKLRLAEVLQEMPQLEPLYRQAFEWLRAEAYFHSGRPIPSLMEICCPLFNISYPNFHPHDHKPPENLDEIIPELIQLFKRNPQLILRCMMLGLIKRFPVVKSYDENSFHIVTIPADYPPINIKRV